MNQALGDNLGPLGHVGSLGFTWGHRESLGVIEGHWVYRGSHGSHDSLEVTGVTEGHIGSQEATLGHWESLRSQGSLEVTVVHRESLGITGGNMGFTGS